MKFLILSFVLLLSSKVFSAPVEGKVFYKKSDGEIVKRVVTLDVPSRGIGEVILSGDNFEWRSSDFKTVKKNGKTSFIVSFKTQFRDFKSTIVLKGSYVKGTNKILYYGDMYKKTGHFSLDHGEKGYTYNGGFKFSYTLD